MHYSPLRYPGGKNKIAGFIQRICLDNNISEHYIEPYAGGASVALSLLIAGTVRRITINDKDRSLYAFWHSVLNSHEELCDLIINTEITIPNWETQKLIQKEKENASLIDLGFSTLFLNRTNRSGIINAGAIGGRKQEGNYKMDCRFNKESIVARIRRIAQYRDSISLHNLDAIEFIQEMENEMVGNSEIMYIDPPYYVKGSSLYMNHYKPGDHKLVADKILASPINWIVSYDNESEIKSLYEGVRCFEYEFKHTANISKLGKEVLFFSNDIVYPALSPTSIRLALV